MGFFAYCNALTNRKVGVYVYTVYILSICKTSVCEACGHAFHDLADSRVMKEDLRILKIKKYIYIYINIYMKRMKVKY